MPKSELIRNIYFLFCYAWEKLPTRSEIDAVAKIDSPDLPNLLAKLLLNEAEQLLAGGLYRSYKEHLDESRFVRGRLVMAALRYRVSPTSLLLCEVEDLDVDVLINRLIRAALNAVGSHPNVDTSLRREVNRALLDFPAVGPISLDSTSFSRVQVHRGNQRYRQALFLSEMIATITMPDRDAKGAHRFPGIPGERIMAQVFETFLFNFAAAECDLKGKRETLSWMATGHPAHLAYLPQMHTDLTVSCGEFKAVVDAKYYESALAERHGKSVLQSANLYQLLAYLRHAGPPQYTQGMLVYSVFDLDPPLDLHYGIESYPVRVYGLDLGKAWPTVSQQLRDLLKGLFL